LGAQILNSFSHLIYTVLLPYEQRRVVKDGREICCGLFK